jgi:predicted Fe-Mo cluster-binding NifX family protein
MKIAVPSMTPGGMDAPISDHFGHCDIFTLVDVEDNQVSNVTLLANGGHVQGGCMAPVMLLKNAGVDTLSAGGMGPRPLAGFQEVAIEVFYNEGATTVNDAVTMILTGQCRKFGPAQTCGGGGQDHSQDGGCGSH